MGIMDKIFGGGIFDLVGKVIDRIGLPAEKKAEIQLAMLNNTHEIEKLEVEFDTKLVEQVNQTMREEAKSEHFMQWSWRPVVGFTFSAILVNNYILLPYFAKYGVVAISVPGEVWAAMLVILGVAAGTRGWQKIVEAKNGAQK